MNNRIFKFRVWDKDQCEFIDLSCGHHNQKLNEFFADNHFVFQQFTGLADYTGTDIYEGDIIQETYKSLDPTKTIPNTYSWEDGCVWKEDARIYEVKYTPPSFNIFSRLGPCKDFYRKIVGNTFQNSNLITSFAL